MKLAINASEAAIQARQKNRLPIDLLKTGLHVDWIQSAAASGSYYVHFPLGTGPTGVINFDYENTDWPWIERLLKETESLSVNLHILFSETLFGADCSVEKYLELCRWSILELGERFGIERVIIENSVARAGTGPTEKISTLGEFFCQLVTETGCGLLLDSAHLRITCLENELDFREEVLRFPLHALKEWHITGVGRSANTNVWFDSMAMTDEDWECTAFVGATFREGRAARPGIVAIEYGGFGEKFEWRSDPDEIIRECRGVRALLDLT